MNKSTLTRIDTTSNSHKGKTISVRLSLVEFEQIQALANSEYRSYTNMLSVLFREALTVRLARKP